MAISNHLYIREKYARQLGEVRKDPAGKKAASHALPKNRSAGASRMALRSLASRAGKSSSSGFHHAGRVPVVFHWLPGKAWVIRANVASSIVLRKGLGDSEGIKLID